MAGDKIYCAETPSAAMEENRGNASSDSKPAQKKHRGWTTMPFILGNETFERLATLGLSANFMVYFMKEYHLGLVSAANLLSIWWGVTNFAPLVGAFISDAYAGKFKTIAFSSFVCILGMMIVTLTAWLPQLRPPKCDVMESFSQCKGPNKSQMGVLLTGLGLLSVGTGGIRPCSLPFGVDQFDPTTEKGAKGINSFFNWYYASLNAVLLIAQTVLVYVQDEVSWVLGFGIPTVLMIGAVILFFVGAKLYVYVEPEGSIFSGIAQVFVAAYKKRPLTLPEGENDEFFYDPPLKDPLISKLPLTNQLRFFNKAAMISDNELKHDGSPINQWRLCSIQQVEDLKCVIKVIPVWASGIITMTTAIQQSTFTVSQALKMDRHIGPKFEIPAGSMVAIQFLTVVIWVPFYDRFIVRSLRKITKHEGGITVLQRCGIGNIFSVLAMVVAGLVERKRRASANMHHDPLGVAPLHVMWLAPQIILLAFVEAFFVIGFTEFLNKQFPDHMKSIANGLQYCIIGAGSYLSSLMATIIHKNTGKHGRPDWLTNDINVGRLDYFYFLIAGMGLVNFIYFLYCAHCYSYKGSVRPDDVKPHPDLELAVSATA